MKIEPSLVTVGEERKKQFAVQLDGAVVLS
jgi:hypothetical protein